MSQNKDKTQADEMKAPIFDNLKYMYSNWWKWDKKSAVYCGLRVPIQVLLPILTVLIPKVMIDCITNQVSPGYLAGTIVILSVMIAGLSWIDPFFQAKMTSVAENTRMQYRIMQMNKILHTDYANMESAWGRELFQKSKDFAFGGRWAPSESFYDTTVHMAGNLLGVFSYIVLLYGLQPTLLAVIAVTCLVELLALRALREVERHHWLKVSRIFMRLDYLFRTASDPKAGKDIRMYRADHWLLDIIAELMAKYMLMMKKLSHQNLKISSLRAVTSLLRTLTAYVFLIGSVLAGKLTVSDFVFYFGIVTGFSAWIMGIVQQYNRVNLACYHCQMFRDFLSLPEQVEGEGKALASNVDCIEFRHVGFTYAGSNTPVLHDINFKVASGEKIAIVGENGAGKTTLIKLLCGFYRPTQGQILLNGVDISEYKKDAYFSAFSAVFQDFNFLPLSIASNITLRESDKIDLEKLEDCLRKAGVWEKITTLEQGVQSDMIKQVNADAADFSGGEKQKLLLARALFKDAPVLILDEPTAALDPIAERNLYEQYDALTRDKTSFFISHRLSSTRFCGRILYVGDGTILEEGTHEELLARRGAYWRMYEMQRYYYHTGKAGDTNDA